ncbi:MAG: trypsin-like peptidase domain-containing protein [Alphaproteobacteria bacterium]|nr:trypsin-like peptidase domain-containing protein [Alphaproteobacteria bacterium]
MIHRTTLSLLLSLSLLCAPLLAAAASQEKGVESHTAPAAPIADASDESPASRKKILDLVRKGVVVIDVKTYASTDSEKRSAWTGSGFIVHIDEKEDYAIIATNRHVAGDMTVSTYNVKFSNGTTAPAHLLYFDPLFDFAFLKVAKTKLPKESIALDLSDKPLELNTSVYTMGNSAKDEFSTYKCTVFSLYEMLGPFAEQSVKFAGLTIPGASGSPGFDEAGKVVLIVYGGKMSSGAGLPIAYVRDALTHLKDKKNPPRRSLGIVPQYVSLEDMVKTDLIPVPAMQEYLNAFPDANNKVLMINSRLAGSDAAHAFEAGDILWKINDTFIGPKTYTLDHSVNNTADKDGVVNVEFYRKGELKKANVKTYPMTLESAQHMITFADATWIQNSEFLKLFLGHAEDGVFMLGVGQTSPFRTLFNGDLPPFFLETRIVKIIEIDGKPIKTLNELAALIPSLMSKRELTVKFIDYMGMIGLGLFAPADRKERLSVVSYESKFDSPKYYAFNNEKNEWDTTDLGGTAKTMKTGNGTVGMSLYKEEKKAEKPAA